jgi:hypothetical protein
MRLERDPSRCEARLFTSDARRVASRLLQKEDLMSEPPSRGLHPDAWLRQDRPPPPRPMGLLRTPGRRRAPRFTTAVVICALLIPSLPTLAGCGGNGPPGQWAVVQSPDPGSIGSILTRLTVVTGSDIWAVGSYTPSLGSPSKTLTVHYNGTSWEQKDSPNLGLGNNVLTDVVAVSTNDVWAVGWYAPDTSTPPQPNKTLIMHWNGTSWTPMPSPNGASGDSVLIGVEKVAANDIWAVGYCCHTSTSGTQTLIEHWTNSTWSVVQSPSPGVYDELHGISAVAANDIWAVGYSTPSLSNVNATQTLIEHYDGTNWSVMSSRSPGSGINQLNDVEAINASNVWAVGYSNGISNTGPQTLTLIDQWNGSSWVPVQSDNYVSSINQLWGVAGVAANDIWAVGWYAPTASLTMQTLTQHWNGASWANGLSANQASSDNMLSDVAAVTATDVWAVGCYTDASGLEHTLVLHFT